MAKKITKNTNKKGEKLDLMLDLILKHSQHQDDVYVGHLTKINTLLAVEGLTIALFIERIGYISFASIFTHVNCFLSMGGFATLFLAVLFALRALTGKAFKYKPELAYIYTDETLKQDLEDYKEDTIADIKDASEFNKTKNEETAKYISMSIFTYIIGLVVQLLALIKT